MASSYSREDQLLKKLQSCVGKIDSRKMQYPQESKHSYGKQNLTDDREGKSTFQSYKFGSAARNPGSQSYHRQKRPALGQFDINNNKAIIQRQNRVESNYKNQTITPRNSSISQQELCYRNKFDYQQQSNRQMYQKKNRGQQYQTQRPQIVLNKQNTKDRYKSRNYQKSSYHELNTQVKNNQEYTPSYKNRTRENQYSSSKYNFRSSQTPEYQVNPHQFKSNRVNQYEGNRYESNQKSYNLQSEPQIKIGKYQYQFGENLNRMEKSQNRYRQRRMSLNMTCIETQPKDQTLKRGMGIGSITSTASKRNQDHDRPQNSSFHFDKEDVHKRGQQETRKSYLEEKPDKYYRSGATNLRSNTKNDCSFDYSRQKSVLPLSLATQNSSKEKASYLQRQPRQQARSIELQPNNEIHTKIQQLKNLKTNDIPADSPNIDTMQKLKRINQLNQKINSRIKNIIDSFDKK